VSAPGDLPAARVNRTIRAFIYTGVDYVDPIAVRTASGQEHKLHKTYITLFVRLTALHLARKLVSDYSSSIFITAYQRFISHRELLQSMYFEMEPRFTAPIGNCPMRMRGQSEIWISVIDSQNDMAFPTSCVATLRQFMESRREKY